MTQPMRSHEELAQRLMQAVEAPDPRRASPRASLSAEVDLSSDTNFFSGFSTDIAAGGLFIATLTVLEIGSTVTVKFTLPDRTEISATGEVRWARVLDERAPQVLPGMGIQFLDLSPKAKASIENFIAQREPMFFPD